LESNGWHIHQGPLTSKDRADHLVGYAEALAASGNPERSLAIAEQVITSCDGVAWPDLHGRAHRARARALRHREPGTAERAAQRAMAYLNVAGKFEESTEIGTEFFIQPYQSLTKIDIDNQARAEAEREQREQEAAIRARHERDIVAASVQSDPIEDQVSQPTGDAGAASA
jgi:hypothetical protein